MPTARGRGKREPETERAHGRERGDRLDGEGRAPPRPGLQRIAGKLARAEGHGCNERHGHGDDAAVYEAR